MYPIVQSPADVLREPTKPVDISRPDLPKIINEMIETMLSQRDPEGVGLAANQVGLPIQIFIARWDTEKDSKIHVFINPQILDHSDKFQKEEKKTPLEGCLSLPKFYGHVKRWEWVKVKYQTLDYSLPSTAVVSSQWTTETFEGFPATVIQHEMDHLNGRIFVERILEQDGALFRVTGKDKNGKEKWEEVEI